jgi:hypothetical protein
MSILVYKIKARSLDVLIYQGFRTMRSIFRQFYALDLKKIAGKDHLIELSERLTGYYFSGTFRKKPGRAEEIRELYNLALIFYPLQVRLLARAYHCLWSPKLLCSWFRSVVNRRTRQFWFKKVAIPDSEADFSWLYERLSRTDPEWLEFQFLKLKAQGERDSRPGVLARLISGPFLYRNSDLRMNEKYGIFGNTYERQIRRKKRLPTASGLRILNTYYLFGDKRCAEEKGWIDLREQPVEILDFIVRYEKTRSGEGVVITINPSVIRDLMAEIRVILEDCNAHPEYRLHLANERVRYLAYRVSGAKDSGRQLFDFDRWYAGKVRRILLPALPKASRRIELSRKYLDTKLVRLYNPFYETNVDRTFFLQMFSPYKI